MAVNTEPNVTANTTLSPDAAEMLRVTGRSHLCDVTDEEWSRYAAQHALTGREAICIEYWNWHLPDQRFLELISGKERSQAQLEYWESVRRTTADGQVQAHAENQIKLLQNANERGKL
jgi:hypothetical protein